MIGKDYKKLRKKKEVGNSEDYEKEIDELLEQAAQIFLEGKKWVILRLPSTSEEFWKKLKKTAYDEWNFDIKKKCFGKVKIYAGIIYEYPF